MHEHSLSLEFKPVAFDVGERTEIYHIHQEVQAPVPRSFHRASDKAPKKNRFEPRKKFPEVFCEV
jgi:hypothetical protein